MLMLFLKEHASEVQSVGTFSLTFIWAVTNSPDHCAGTGWLNGSRLSASAVEKKI